MLKNLVAVVFLVLAVSPFTAPFQTFNETRETVAPPLNENDPGSLVGPLVTKASRVTIAPPTGSVNPYFASVSFLTPFIPLTRPVRHDAFRPAVLRL